MSEHQLDIVMDHLYTLNELTPKIKCSGVDGVDPQLVFGIYSSATFDNMSLQTTPKPDHNDEVEVIQLQITSDSKLQIKCTGSCDHTAHKEGLISCRYIELTKDRLNSALSLLSREYVWRVKGFLRMDSSVYILNWAFGRYNLYHTDKTVDNILQLTFVGDNRDLQQALQPFIDAVTSL